MVEEFLLAERFEALLTQEREAVEIYADLAARADDAAIRSQFEQLCREKSRHVELTERLLEIVD